MLAGDGEAEVADGGSTGVFDVRRVNPGGEELAAQASRIFRGEGDDGSEVIGSVTEVFPK